METFGLIGTAVTDPHHGERTWAIDGVYAPIAGRAVGGVRVHATDQKGFISFINQRDLEVLLGIGQPGQFCRWLGKDYVDPFDRENWFGFTLDEEDLRDDLYAREQELRFVQEEVTGGIYLPPGLELTRRLHLSRGVDVEELLFCNGDQASEEYSPDMRINTIDVRWTRVERTQLIWRQV